MKKISLLLSLLLLLSLVGCSSLISETPSDAAPTEKPSIIGGWSNGNTLDDVIISTSYDSIPDYSGEPYCIINGNVPYFTDGELTTECFENYSELDSLGRCGVAYACLSKETMPAEGEERGEIGMVKPAGWHTVKYPEVISDLYLYNRCHLIGWQLCAENANVLNLTTGTRYLNVEGMLPFENQVDDYIDETGNHVLYRVTPIFVDDELVCRGILMEAKSIEDDGCVFCVYCYNVQPHIGIDYKTGESNQLPDVSEETTGEKMYVLNNSSKKVHVESCDFVKKMSEENREDYYGTLDEILENGFTACGSCKPE